MVPPKPAEKKPLKQRIKDKLPHWMSMTFIMNNRCVCVRERQTIWSRETDSKRDSQRDRD